MEENKIDNNERLLRISKCCDGMEFCRKNSKNNTTKEAANKIDWLNGELGWLIELHILLYEPEKSDFALNCTI